MLNRIPGQTRRSKWQLHANEALRPGRLRAVASSGGGGGGADYTSTSVASASTVDISALATDYALITGTTTITALTITEGDLVIVRFSGILTLTHGSSLILSGGQSITTYDGLVMAFVGEASSVVREVSRNVPISIKSSVASTSGATIDFTGIPSWANRIIVTLSSVSTNGTSQPLLQIGDSGGVEATSYTCGSAIGASQTNYTTGWGIFAANAANVIHATYILTRVTGDTWGCGMTFGLSSSANAGVVGGSKTLSGTLDRVRMTTVNGTDTYDAGIISIEVC